MASPHTTSRARSVGRGCTRTWRSRPTWLSSTSPSTSWGCRDRFERIPEKTQMTTTDFDARAETWDDDPAKVERARAVADEIIARVPLSRTMRALEYGCGTGLLSFMLRERVGDITLADVS